MRVLTLTQPWATLVARGAKRIETRSRPCRYRGPLAIQAGVGLSKHVLGTSVGGLSGLEELVLEDPFYEALRSRAKGDGGFTGGHQLVLPDGEPVWERSMYRLQVPLGAIVAVAQMVDCVPTEEFVVPTPGRMMGSPVREDGRLIGPQEAAFGDYTPGRYAWVLRDVRPMARPIPYLNGQGLRHLDERQVSPVTLFMQAGEPS